MKILDLVLALCVLLLMSLSVSAVETMRHTRIQTFGDCPNGQCPNMVRAVVKAPVVATASVVRTAVRLPAAIVREVVVNPVQGLRDGTYYQNDGYASRYTYPGTIKSHLASSFHGVSTAGMSKVQMEQLHDSLHLQNTTPTRQLYSQSVCPNGQCPTQPTVNQFRIFPRLFRR